MTVEKAGGVTVLGTVGVTWLMQTRAGLWIFLPRVLAALRHIVDIRLHFYAKA
jgi:hypothetical protein